MISIIGNVNLFQATADGFHVLAMLILIVYIWRRKSFQGVSGKSQILFGLVFTSRYLDLFTASYIPSLYLEAGKVTYILLTYFTIFSIYWQFRSRENRNMDSFRAEMLVIPLFGLAILANYEFSAFEIAWAFSEYLEVVAIIPQLYVIMKTGYAESFVITYLLTLAAYKALYICNWLYKYYSYMHYDRISTYSGCFQTLILFIGVWLAHAANWKPRYKDLKPQIPVIPSPIFNTDPGVDQKESIATVVTSLSQSADVLDADDRTPLYSHDA